MLADTCYVKADAGSDYYCVRGCVGDVDRGVNLWNVGQKGG